MTRFTVVNAGQDLVRPAGAEKGRTHGDNETSMVLSLATIVNELGGRRPVLWRVGKFLVTGQIGRAAIVSAELFRPAPGPDAT